MLLKTILQGEGESLLQWFEEVRQWDTSTVSKERFLWLKIQGVPAHAWEEVCFQQLANLVGKYIKMDSATQRKTDWM